MQGAPPESPMCSDVAEWARQVFGGLAEDAEQEEDRGEEGRRIVNGERK